MSVQSHVVASWTSVVKPVAAKATGTPITAEIASAIR
jgi:hypothetical protein